MLDFWYLTERNSSCNIVCNSLPSSWCTVHNLMMREWTMWWCSQALDGAWLYRYSWKCEPVDWSRTPHAMRVARGFYVYFLAKMTELLDTVSSFFSRIMFKRLLFIVLLVWEWLLSRRGFQLTIKTKPCLRFSCTCQLVGHIMKLDGHTISLTDSLTYLYKCSGNYSILPPKNICSI